MFNPAIQLVNRRGAIDRPFTRLFNGIGAEVGSHTGWYSCEILKRKQVAMLFVVDSFLPWHAHTLGNKVLNQWLCRIAAGLMMARFKPWRYRRICALSWNGSRDIPDGSLDFVYLDAGHDYDSVKRDIAAWWPKVKPGGIFAGNDYFSGCPGVIQAVNEFAAANNLWVRERSYDFERGYTDFLIHKPTTP